MTSGDVTQNSTSDADSTTSILHSTGNRPLLNAEVMAMTGFKPEELLGLQCYGKLRNTEAAVGELIGRCHAAMTRYLQGPA